MDAKNYIIGFLVGGALGGALGILFAPKSGPDLRADIRHKAEGLYDQTKSSLADKKGRIERGFAAAVSTYKQ